MGSDSTLAILKPTVKNGQTASVFISIVGIFFAPNCTDFLLLFGISALVLYTLESDIYIGYFIKYTMQGRPPVS